jgi:hypothetical protein
VALRAYSVPRSEQVQIFSFIFKEFVRSPRDFIFPRRSDSLAPIIEPTGKATGGGAIEEPKVEMNGALPAETTVAAEAEEQSTVIDREAGDRAKVQGNPMGLSQ